MSAPRWSLAVLSLVHAPVFGLAAKFLPWKTFTIFAGLALLIAALHVSLVALAVIGSDFRARVLRFTAWIVLGFLGYLSYVAFSSGLYLANLYSGIGVPLACAAAAAWCVVVLFTLPFGLWGIAKTGGLRLSRGVPVSSAIFSVTVAFAMAARAGSARGASTLTPDTTRDSVRAALQERLGPLARPKVHGSIFSPSPAVCPSEPSPGSVTLLASYRHKGSGAAVVCTQGPTLEAAIGDIAKALTSDYEGGPVSVDVVRRTQRLGALGPFMGAVSLRPADDGVCLERRCLAPFQLVGIDAFTQLSAVDTFDVKLGLSAPSLRKAIGKPEGSSFDGLVRIDTMSFVVLPNGDVEPLHRLRPKAAPLSSPSLARSIKAAGAFIVHAQEGNGRFHYTTDPFTGATSMSGFGIPRQAGTTLSLCDARRFIPEAETVAVRSLSLLASLEVKKGDRSGMGFSSTDKQPTWLGSSALTMVAFLACRDLVGTRFDPIIDRLGRGILASERSNGSFAPRIDIHAGKQIDDKLQLYASGQAVLALVMWEAARGNLDRPSDLGLRIDAAMDYTAGPYWSMPLRDFFFLEENWHCLAAREALKSHRRDGYERFCLDYMKMKTKLMIEEGDTNDPDFIGGYAFGTLIPPHNAATGGFAEALAAAVDIERARGLDATADEARVKLVLEYLLRHQWTDEGCFFCTDRMTIAGAFSENIGSPYIRIDFLQHTLAGLNHGGETLALVDPPSGSAVQ